jgi:hypothetical protein
MKRTGHSVFTLLMLIIFILLLFNSSIVFSEDSIPIDLSSSNLSVISSDTIRIDNLKVPGFDGTYWATFRWNASMYKFEIIDAGVSGVSTVNFSGSWAGTWYSIYSKSGNITASISQVNSSLSGNMTLTNTDLGTVTINHSGTVNGNMLDLSGSWSLGGYEGDLYVSGTLSGNTITGDYDLYVDGEGLYDNGTFIIER